MDENQNRNQQTMMKSCLVTPQLASLYDWKVPFTNSNKILLAKRGLHKYSVIFSLQINNIERYIQLMLVSLLFRKDTNICIMLFSNYRIVFCNQPWKIQKEQLSPSMLPNRYDVCRVLAQCGREQALETMWGGGSCMSLTG